MFRCAGFFEDGKWSEMTENTSSAEKVDILLVEVSGLSLEEIRASDKFQGLVCDYFDTSLLVFSGYCCLGFRGEYSEILEV